MKVNNISAYRPFNYNKNISFKQIYRNTEDLSDTFSYETKRQASFVNFITKPEYTYGEGMQPSILTRILADNDTDSIKQIFNKLQDDDDKYKVAKEILTDVNQGLTLLIDEDFISQKRKIFKATMYSLSQQQRNQLLESIKDAAGNSLLVNAMYQKNTNILRDIFAFADDETLAKLLVKRNLHHEYPIGFEENFNKKHQITRHIFYNDKFKKIKIPKETIEIVRLKVLEILENPSISKDMKMKLCFVYAPRDNEKNDYTYSDFRKMIVKLSNINQLQA